MKTLFFFLIILAPVLSATEEKSHTHAHHHESGTTKLTLNEGKKWETDAPLRKSMEAIRVLFRQKAKKFHGDGLSKQEYINLATSVEAQTQEIFKNCKLPQKADEALHLLLIPMIEGVKTMKEGEKEKRKTGFFQVVQSLLKYPKYFNHPDWKGIH